MEKIDKGTYFVTGIDTDAGKSFATGILARRILDRGMSVITQKFIQTGCQHLSEDIETHRRLMGLPLQEVDLNGTTCAEVFTFPASPHLASRIDDRPIDLDKIKRSTSILEQQYDIVLIEGAGGLMVPITEDYLTADYIKDNNLPILLVTSPRLGSINHTLLTLEICRSRGIEVAGVIYNHYPTTDKLIEEDTFRYICRYIERNHPNTLIYETENQH